MPRLARLLGPVLVAAALSLMSAWAVPPAQGTPTGSASSPGTQTESDESARSVQSAQPEQWGPTDLLLFWGDGCPHCAAEKEWLERVEQDYPDISVHEFEVWFDESNRALFLDVAAELGFEASGVPVTVLGDRYWVGWSELVRQQLTAEIESSVAAFRGEPGDEGETGAGIGPATDLPEPGTTIDVPVLGEVTLGQSLVASTLVIGFVDGMNPCSLWVITVLLAIVVRTGGRGRVIAIGTTYLAVTALMYGLFILGVYSALSLVSHLGVVQVVVAVVAGGLGVVSVKDYFAFRRGVSTTISDSAKPGLYQRMRGAAGQRSLLPALGATIALAIGVSFIEIPCTAGFPLLWAGLLEANDVGLAQGLGLLGLFMVPYLLDELVVFGVAVVTMRSLKMQERHGRLLKLVAGTMMIALAITVLLAPAAMATPVVAVLIFTAAVGVAVLVHLVTRAVRPDVLSTPSTPPPGDRARTR
jgi:thiol-disulfide isomerase/thioredoxin